MGSKYLAGKPTVTGVANSVWIMPASVDGASVPSEAAPEASVSSDFSELRRELMARAEFEVDRFFIVLWYLIAKSAG